MAIFWTSAGRIGIWKYPFCRSSFKKIETSYPGREISNGGQSISVRNGGSVEATQITTGSPGTVRFMYHVEKRRRGVSNNPCFLHLEKLHLGGG